MSLNPPRSSLQPAIRSTSRYGSSTRPSANPSRQFTKNCRTSVKYNAQDPGRLENERRKNVNFERPRTAALQAEDSEVELSDYEDTRDYEVEEGDSDPDSKDQVLDHPAIANIRTGQTPPICSICN